MVTASARPRQRPARRSRPASAPAEAPERAGEMLRLEYVDPATLQPAPYNPRHIESESLQRLAALLDAHGFVDPVIARREDRLIIGGHQRLKANSLRKRPAAIVPCVFLDGLDDARAKALNIALNNAATQGQFDEPMLADLLAELRDTDLDVVAATGFSADEIAELTDDLPFQDEGPGPTIPETFEIVIECESEGQQQELFERFEHEGLKCRLLNL
jgi:hypothetical protein